MHTYKIEHKSFLVSHKVDLNRNIFEGVRIKSDFFFLSIEQTK